MPSKHTFANFKIKLYTIQISTHMHYNITMDIKTITSPETLKPTQESRTPPGQSLTKKWPVLHYGPHPNLYIKDWQLKITGLVKNPIALNWQQFNDLPKVNLLCDIHCVTHWSKLDNTFQGVQTKTLLNLAQPLPNATHVIQHGKSAPADDWTTNLPLTDFAQENCIIATHHNESPLSPEHGYPARTIVPHLYFWKGAKWITEIELTDQDKPGFWEVNGYHMYGDPWKEQRFAW